MEWWAAPQSWLEQTSGWFCSQVPPIRAALYIAGAFIAAKVVDWFTVKVLRVLVKRTATGVDDQIVALSHGPVIKTVVLVGLGLATDVLIEDDGAHDVVIRVLQTVALVLWVSFALRATSLLLTAASELPDRFRPVEARTFPLFDNLGKLILVALAAYLVMLIWDLDVTTWLASAGIIGIALGFAAQDTLGNLFSGIFIIADKPYQLGDYVVLDTGERGEVANIGLRSTRLVTRDDVEITVPNAVMGNAKIVNESRGPWRKERIRVGVSVAYGSDIDEVRQVLLDVAAASTDVTEHPEPRVRFRAFGASGLDVELLVWIEEAWMRGRATDALNTAVYKAFNAAGIEIPYSKHDVYVKQWPSPPPSSPPAS